MDGEIRSVGAETPFAEMTALATPVTPSLPLFRKPPSMLLPMTTAEPDSALAPVVERVATPAATIDPEFAKVPMLVAGQPTVAQAMMCPEIEMPVAPLPTAV